MKNKTITTAVAQEKVKLLRELSTLSMVIRGTMLERYSTCSRKGCACHRGRRHGPRNYVSVTRAKRQRQHYVPQAQLHQAKQGVRQYHRMLAILDRLTEINLKLMRKGELHGNEGE